MRKLAAVAALGLLVAGVFWLLTDAASAHKDRPDCSESALGVSLEANVTSARPRDVIIFTAGASNVPTPGQIACRQTNIRLRLTLPSGRVVNRTFALLESGQTRTFSVGYVARRPHLAGEGNAWISTLDVQSTAHIGPIDQTAYGNVGTGVPLRGR